MSNYNSLKTTINANVKQNGVQAITGQILNSVLNAMVNTLGAGYQFAGVATTATNPGSPDAKVFYIANGKGTYTYFGGLQVTEDDVVVLYWDSSWHKVSTGIASYSMVSELDAIVNGVIIRSLDHLKINRGGKVSFDDITLSQDGDSLEMDLVVDSDVDTDYLGGLAFATNGGQASISLSTYTLGIKNVAGNWLQGMNYANGQYALGTHRVNTRGTIKIVYESGVINLYVNGDLLHSVSQQTGITINALGSAIINETERKWSGTIYRFDYISNGVTKGILDFDNINFNSLVDVYVNETSENGLSSRVEALEELVPLTDVEKEYPVSFGADEFIAQSYITGASITNNYPNYDTYYYFATRNSKIYVKSVGSSTAFFRVLVGNGTLSSHTYTSYASSASAIPTKSNMFDVVQGQLVAISVISGVSNFELVEVIAETERVLSEDVKIPRLDTLIEGSKPYTIIPKGASAFDLESISDKGNKLIYSFSLRHYTREIGGVSVLCGDVWNNDEICNTDGNPMVQGNTNFIIAIDGALSGFADERKDYHAGPGHGCEVAEYTKFYADGVLVDPSTMSTPVKCSVFRMVQASNVYAVDATLSDANHTGNANNYPRVVDGSPVVSAHHLLDFTFSKDNSISGYNQLIIKRNGTIFNNCSCAMLQGMTPYLSEVMINDNKSSWSHFERVSGNIVQTLVNGEDVISYVPRIATREKMMGEGILVSQSVESLDPSRYGKMRIWTPPVYNNRVKSYFFPCITSITGDYETFDNGDVFEIKISRKIDY